MNKIKYIYTILSLLLIFGACSEDKKLMYDPNNVAPGQLQDINPSYVLEITKAADVAQIFNWGAFDMGYNATVTYALEMDIAGNNFANAITLASGNSLTASVTVGQLNAVMVKLQQIYEFADATAQNVEFRVRGSISPSVDPFYTNVVSTLITPYAADVEFPKVYVIGDFNGWNHANDQFLWAFTGGSDYEGWVGFGGKAQNGFKLTGIPGWDSASGNWGAPSADGQTPEASTMTLINGDGSQNIFAYSKNFYKFSYNTSSLTLSVELSMNTLSIIGDGGIDWNTDIPFTFDTQTQQFVAITTLQDGSIKFRGDNTWGSVNLGLPADADAFVPSGTLINGNDSKNIPVVAGTYKITLDLNNSANMTYKFESMEALDPSKITAQTLTHDDLAMDQNKSDKITWTALDFGGQTPTAVTYTVEMALKGTNFANAQTLGTTSETSLTVSGDAYLAALEAIDSSIGLDKATDVDMRVTATVQGLTDTFTSNVATFNLTIQAPPLFPDELYMNGDDFGGSTWDWSSPTIVSMIPVNGTPGSFWCIKYFHAGTGFKWAPVKDWAGSDFGVTGNGPTYNIGGGNASVAEDGLYLVYIDMSANTITIEPAKVYGIGDCFGGWDSGVPFTVSDSKASITTTGGGDVRMYAASSAPTATPDWWRMEFVILNGQIAYRGNGGDQDRVSVNAGQTVTLDFSNDTGTIQ